MTSDRENSQRLVVVGGGVAGCMGGIYCARAGFDTIIVDGDESILRRNAHLENVPGFPAGVNSRTFLSLLRQQANRSGVHFEEGLVSQVAQSSDEFDIHIESSPAPIQSEYVLLTSWADTSYLSSLPVDLIDRGSKTYIDVDQFGRTGIDGLYAAGRIAEKPHQTVVAAGHGAEVALTIIDDSPVPFYHDWVAPSGYFTERGRDVPPGVEEITESERRRRERESMHVMQDAFEKPHPDEPTMHPSVIAKRDDSSED